MISATKSESTPIVRRLGLLVVSVVATASLGAVSAPAAHAGGPGTTYIYGTSKANCATNLKNSVEAQRVFGHSVTGIEPCIPATGHGTYTWFGSYVVH